MRPAPAIRHVTAVLFLLLLAALQLFVLIRRDIAGDGAWFLYGRDTIYQDSIQILWVQQWMERDPGRIPLWISEVQGGIPTLGAFFWTPFSPHFLPYWFLEFPHAQKLAWLMTLWIAGCGAYILGRATRLRWWPAVFLGAAWMLCGHVVTLIHAGHFQKVSALAWMGWAMAGAVMASDPHLSCRRARGAALVALALGMMILGGHPQIAYTALCMVALWMLWSLWIRGALRRSWWRQGLLFGAAIAAGFAASGAQLLPGMEMSAVSNRAGGVSFEEATETSYPPGELAELLIPRIKGSSVFGDSYTGDWGERIVSDYTGAVVLLLAFLGMLGPGVRGKYSQFWMAVAAISLLVGVGNHTPVYGFLYSWLPGFASFRSPGTFMAAAALAFAVLGAIGLQVLLEYLKNRRRWISPICLVVVALAAADLGRANRHFLLAHSWEAFDRDFLGPRSMDLRLEGDLALGVHDAVAELNLRPILYGRRAVNGYYPISFHVKKSTDEALGFGTRAWYNAWGITHLLIPVKSEVRPPATHVERFADPPRDLIAIGDTRPMVSINDQRPVHSKWIRREPNSKELQVEGPAGTLEIAEVVSRGWTISVGGSDPIPVTGPHASTELQHAGGRTTVMWQYAPRSYAVGLFAAGAGWMMVGIFAGYALRRRAWDSPH